MNADMDHAGGHLDELALDALRAGEGSPEGAAHLESCPRCRAALAGLALLEGRLRVNQPRLPEVPLDIEHRIFRAYRETIGRRGPAPFPMLVRRWALPAAGLTAAAAVTLTLRLAPPENPQKDLPEPARVAIAPSPTVVPAEGLEAAPPATADIVDAFRLARALRDGRQATPGWDVDGDGAVGGADVQALARQAVAL